MPRHDSDSIRKKEDNVRYDKGNAIAGDSIIYECRKPGHIHTVRGSSNHNIYQGILLKDAYAKINKIYTNKQK